MISDIFLTIITMVFALMVVFSKKTVDNLRDLKIKFDYFDIFSDEEIRQGVKEYANWPTIPQLYINGEFVGGCDIVDQLVRNGELQRLAIQ